jgi:hypothetical protein
MGRQIRGISANWIYYLEQTIRGVFRGGYRCALSAGACGDVHAGK